MAIFLIANIVNSEPLSFVVENQVLVLTDSNFDEAIEANNLIMILFYSQFR